MGRDLARVLWRWVKEVQGLGLVFRIQGTPSAPLAGPEAQACMLAGVNWVKLQCKVMRYEYLEDINAGKPAHTHTHADPESSQAPSLCRKEKVRNCSEGPPVRDRDLVKF